MTTTTQLSPLELMNNLSTEFKTLFNFSELSFKNLNFVVQEQFGHIAENISQQPEVINLELVTNLIKGNNYEDIYSTASAFDLSSKINLIARNSNKEETTSYTSEEETLEEGEELSSKKTKSRKSKSKDPNKILEEFVFSYKQLLEENKNLKQKLEGQVVVSNPLMEEIERLLKRD